MEAARARLQNVTLALHSKKRHETHLWHICATVPLHAVQIGACKQSKLL